MSDPPNVPDFDLIRLIGEGGFGQVWLAANQATGQLRAVKVIPLQRAGTADPAGREITSIVRLEANVRTHHPNLLNIHHVAKTADCLFYIMDPADDVSGNAASPDATYRPATLETRLANGPLPPDECLSYARQLLAGLARLHEADMVHRDVKPANCLFVGGDLKLADFGLLTEADQHVSRVGTVKYMPPDGRMDTRADVYAAGLVIYEMITGLPVDGFPRLGKQAHEVAKDPTLGRLNRLVLRACAPDPRQRFQDAGKMLANLEAPDAERSAARVRLRRRVVSSIVCILLVVALVAVGLWFGRTERVHVNFITEPFEATICLDGKPLLKPDGAPYKTPCTVPDLSARGHHVVFEHEGLPKMDIGRIDFATTREVSVRWEVDP